MISQPRMCMQRVRSDSCSVHKDFQDEIDICYDSYSQAAESTSPFIEQGEATVNESSSVSKAYKYADLPGSILTMILGEALPYLRMYYAGGYLQFLPGDKGTRLRLTFLFYLLKINVTFFLYKINPKTRKRQNQQSQL